MLSAEQQYLAATQKAVFFPSLDSGIFKVSGADCVRYLHGRVTQDIKALKLGQAASSLLLTPQGRVQGHFTVVAQSADSFFLLSDPLDAEGRASFISALLQFKVADRVEVADCSADYGLNSIQGATAQSLLEKVVNDSLPTAPLATKEVIFNGNSITVICNPKGVAAGYDILLEKSVHSAFQDAILSSSDVVLGDGAGWEMLRVIAGVAKFGIDINEKTLGPELAPERIISFTKGCYSGQEVVERATAKGKTSQRIYKLKANGEIKVGAIISVNDNGEQKDCGNVSSSCYLQTANCSYAIAAIKTSVPEGSQLFVEGIEVENLKQI